ncbi:DUF2637 domain-containing protein [Streptomyces sp. NBC_01728]|uniref:DUF2637 domain-containing protein n=1 Tax=unclassified Streptomyces TaxID=2593676 RepID=UPI0022548F5B|nr:MULTISPECIES: DUF2637 domain-containing protein [unclassified Streptomyces]MCX4455764.1 DUF2637 domain-containing protein [Streptomyces sp. NBC_01719]MCX4495124.1 DUF2637 domain-containing protein [Streptomyces sp. NBC_01728]
MRGNRSIRVGIVLLAAVAFALSYDALRQMAVASHVRGLLTYLFPLVIDGFIAIGIVALLLLRTAPVRSRLYVWTLVGVATGTSISANVVHAVGLNEGTRLRLNNATAGALSGIAPLALAGAVHLYLVINRHLAANSAAAAASPATPLAESAAPKEDRQARQEQADDATTAPSAKASSTPTPEEKPDATMTSAAKKAPRAGQRKRTVPEEKLLAIARAIGTETGQVPRTALEKAVRAKGYTISKDDAQKAAATVTAELTAAKNAIAA